MPSSRSDVPPSRHRRARAGFGCSYRAPSTYWRTNSAALWSEMARGGTSVIGMAAGLIETSPSTSAPYTAVLTTAEASFVSAGVALDHCHRIIGRHVFGQRGGGGCEGGADPHEGCLQIMSRPAMFFIIDASTTSRSDLAWATGRTRLPLVSVGLMGLAGDDLEGFVGGRESILALEGHVERGAH